MPKVSICVPNLNTRPYLPERFETIFNQTFQDWELIVCDSYSDDGSWEYIQELAAREPRMRITQTPRNGIYAGFNDCIKLARGEYVYIATSDDTMAVDCLDKLVAALDSHAECDLAHCALRVIGDGAEQMNRWWAKDSLFAKSSSELINRRHIRRAPFDALLQLCGNTVYLSMTQLLIRRSLFDRIGLFDGRWGSIGDFHWQMRASLVANTIHVPDTWGGWRLHSAQATAQAGYGSMAHRKKIQEMIDDAIHSGRRFLPHQLAVQLERSWGDYFFSRWLFQRKFDELPSRSSRFQFLLGEIRGGSPIAWSYCGRRLLGSRGWNDPPETIVARWLKQAGAEKNLWEA